MALNRPDGIYDAILTEKRLMDVCEVIIGCGTKSIGIDTETTGLDYLSCDILGVSLAYTLSNNVNVGWYIPVKRYSDQPSIVNDPSGFLPLEVIANILNPILSSNNITKYMHNSKFDLHILSRHGFTVEQPIFDTMIGAWALGNIHGSRYGLKHLAKTKLGIDMIEFSEVSGKNKDFSKVSLDKAVEYAAPDGDITLRIGHIEKDVLCKYPSLEPTMTIEQNVIESIIHMENVGVRINKRFLQETKRTLMKESLSLVDKVYELFGSKFNINSNDQLLSRIRSKFKLYQIENTDISTLSVLLNEDPNVQSLIDYRKRQKIISTYCTGILDKLDKDDRVHTDFYQMLKTGRLSSKDPNLQNVPTKKGDDYDMPPIRRAFIVKDGYKFVSIDYSQLELRVITHVSKEPHWINAFNNDEDIHSSTASAVYKKPISEITKYERKRAKFVNFGLLYGESAYGLSKRENITVQEAQDFIDDYFYVLPYVEDYISSRKDMVLSQGYTETFNGRRLYFRPDRKDKRAVAAAQREGINFPIQGGASDIVKSAMIQVHRLLKPYKTNMILQVHDELNFEMHEDETHILIPQICEIMSSVFKLDVDLKVDVEIGDNWEDIEQWI